MSPLIKHRRKRGDLLAYNYKEKRVSTPSLSKYLPIHFFFGDTTSCEDSAKNYISIDVWYLINDEFVEQLPDRYKSKIKRELDIIDSLKNGSMKMEDACEALKGEKSFFDICRLKSGALENLTVSPNPVLSAGLGKFLLTESRIIDINLHDMNGIFIKNIMKQAKLEAGYQEFSLNVDDIPPGMYLISIHSGKGEHIVEKIIVR